MTFAVYVAVIAAVWGPLGVATALIAGKALHRNKHRAGIADPANCPPWCSRERAAALLHTASGRHRHRAHHTGRIQHLMPRRRRP